MLRRFWQPFFRVGLCLGISLELFEALHFLAGTSHSISAGTSVCVQGSAEPSNRAIASEFGGPLAHVFVVVLVLVTDVAVVVLNVVEVVVVVDVPVTLVTVVEVVVVVTWHLAKSPFS